jgi:hypothetical protein
VTSLPESMKNLENLCILNLPENNLTFLPESVKNLPKVRIFYNNYINIPRDEEYDDEEYEYGGYDEEEYGGYDEEESNFNQKNVSKLDNYKANMVLKGHFFDNIQCPITMEPLSNFKDFLVFHCGHVCSKPKTSVECCPVCRTGGFTEINQN